MDQEAISAPEIRSAFGEFGEWLTGEVGPHKAALTIHRYLYFFEEIGNHWNRIPDYVELLRYFGAESLRRVRLPMRWLQLAKGIDPDPKARELDSERRRIESIISSIPQASYAGRVFESYYLELMSKVESGKIILKSARLALRPAASMLLMTDATGKTMPNQSSVDSYLAESPGQVASLKGFMTFLKRRYQITLKVNSEQLKTGRRKKLERAIKDIVDCNKAGEHLNEHWIVLGMEYFHRKRITRREARLLNVKDDDSGLRIELGGENYWLPRPEDILKRTLT